MPKAAMLKASSWRVCADSHGRAGGQHPDSQHRGWLNVNWWPGSKGACWGEVEGRTEAEVEGRQRHD